MEADLHRAHNTRLGSSNQGLKKKKGKIKLNKCLVLITISPATYIGWFQMTETSVSVLGSLKLASFVHIS